MTPQCTVLKAWGQLEILQWAKINARVVTCGLWGSRYDGWTGIGIHSTKRCV